LLFSISDLTKHSAEKWLDKNIDEVIRPGLKPDNFIKKSFNSNHIIYVGRLEKSKRVDVLIEALSKIKNHPKLIICGFGSQKNSLINLATKLNVDFDYRGVVAEQEKWKLISSSLFMVFPTTFEGFGMPPMEALYCKKPCITTDLKILKSNYGDYLEYVKVNDVDDLSMKIKFLLDNPKYVKERGEKGREFVLNKFSWEKSAELLEKSFESNR
jgi:glycosyltransferase involved in cell wall biosynthesis